jgi:hypothetical protein
MSDYHAVCRYPDCDGGQATGYCHSACKPLEPIPWMTDANTVTTCNIVEQAQRRMSELVDILAGFPVEAKTIDERAWSQLLIYAPANMISRRYGELIKRQPSPFDGMTASEIAASLSHVRVKGDLRDFTGTPPMHLNREADDARPKHKPKPRT